MQKIYLQILRKVFPSFFFAFFWRGVQFEQCVGHTLKVELEPQYNFLVNWLAFAFAKDRVVHLPQKSNLLWPYQKVWLSIVPDQLH